MGEFSNKRILIVEDEPLVAMNLEDMLDTLGCAIAGPAYSLKDGLARVAEGGIDAAILDFNLRGESSREIADALVSRGVPFLIVSGYGADIDCGDAPILAKPYMLNDVKSALAGLLKDAG